MLINFETVKVKNILRIKTSNDSIYSSLEILGDLVAKNAHSTLLKHPISARNWMLFIGIIIVNNTPLRIFKTTFV